MINTNITLNPHPILLGIGCLAFLGCLGASAIITSLKDNKKLSVTKNGFIIDKNNTDVVEETIIDAE